MKWFRFPLFLRPFIPGAIFRINTSGRAVYLTFDDGPNPETTPEIIGTLTGRNIPATFFCTGENIEKYPELISLINNNGFRMANHGFSHLRGRRSGRKEYVDDVIRGGDLTGSDLFRPPYGSLTLDQYRHISRRFKVVFWDLMVYDFDPSMDVERILRVIGRKVRPGSILVLHDSAKSSSFKYLNRVIDMVYSKGYSFGDLLPH